jgi:hypothetical protein
LLDTPELSALGRHGDAIPSRYPLTNVQVITLP